MLEVAVLALGTGAIFGLAALGIIVTYRGSTVLNFAIGAMGLLGGYIYWQLHDLAHWNTGAAMAVGTVASALAGFLTEWLVIRRMRDSSNLMRIVGTLSILIIIDSGLSIINPGFTDPNYVQQILPVRTVSILGASIGENWLIIIVIGITLTALLWAIYRFTSFGLATSAVAENSSGLATLGWSPNTISALNWSIGSAVAGFVTIIVAPLTGLDVSFATFLLLPSLAAAIIGSLRSLPVAFGGAMAIAVAQAEVSRYLNVTGASDAIPLIVIVAVLVFRGRKLPLRNFVNERLPRVPRGRVPVLPTLLAVLGFAMFLEFGPLSAVWISAITTTLVTAFVLLSLVVLVGFAGQLSLAQWSIAGIGAFAAARAATAHVPFIVCLLIAILSAIPICLLVGLPATRVRGMSLAIATLALGTALTSIVLSNPSWNGGPTGLDVGYPSLFGLSLNPIIDPQRYAVFVLICLTVAGLCISNLRRGSAGRRMLAVRSNERAAAALGISGSETKIVAFLYASVIAALGGALYIFQAPYATFTSFDPFISVEYVGYAVLGGIGWASGALFGGTYQAGGVGTQIAQTIFNNYSSANYVALIGGVMLLYTIVQAPDGIVPITVQSLKSLQSRFQKVISIARRVHLGGSRAKPKTSEEERLSLEISVPENSTARVERHVTLTGQNVQVNFGGVRAVNDVSFEISSGEVLGVIGPNGAGKTTLLDAISGFVSMTSGDLWIDSMKIVGLSAVKRSRLGIARSFQSLELFEDLTVAENIAVASETRDRRTWISDLVRPAKVRLPDFVMDFVLQSGLRDFLGRYPRELSYGHRRLVAIARTIASKPIFLLLDEPAAGLDQSDTAELIPVIRRLAERWQMGILLIEHDVRFVASASDRMIALNFGAVIASGSPDEVLHSESVVTSYLGSNPDDVLSPRTGVPEEAEK